MKTYIIAVVVILAMIGAGVTWLSRTIIKAERVATIEKAIALTRDTDKRLKVARKATDADLCRALGGEKGECE